MSQMTTIVVNFDNDFKQNNHYHHLNHYEAWRKCELDFID